MSTTFPGDVSVEEYLAAERVAETKHEYAAGTVYERAGASEAHNRLATNLIASLYALLRGHPCEVFGSDMQVRLPGDRSYFYYPDAMIACDPTDAGHGWRERPSAVFEIISEETRRIDEGDKLLEYLRLPSLEAYVRIEQSQAKVVLIQRTTKGWETREIQGLDGVIVMSIQGSELRLSLAELYARVGVAAV